MKEIRFNLFKSVHKGLKTLLADTLLQIQQTDFQIIEQASSAIELVYDLAKKVLTPERLESINLNVHANEN